MRLLHRRPKPVPRMAPGTIVRVNHEGRNQLATVVEVTFPDKWEGGDFLTITEGLGSWLARMMVVRTARVKGVASCYSARDLLEMEGWLDPEAVAEAREHFHQDFERALLRALMSWLEKDQINGGMVRSILESTRNDLVPI